MYSQCPECQTRFRVTAAALRAAHGTVRCGRCGSAFDALPHLTDTLRADGPEVPPQPALLGLTGTGEIVPATSPLAGEAGSGHEFHFSADDIERVFIDARDWQSRFGAQVSPGERAGRLEDVHLAELGRMVDEAGVADAASSPAGEPALEDEAPPVWVHEPEAVEDITLEGERIEIEGFAGFEEDFLEREIESAIDEQHRLETTGAQRALAERAARDAAELGVVTGDTSSLEAQLAHDDELHDLDSTDQFETLHDVPPEDAPADDDAPHAVAEPMPAAVTATASALAAEASGTVAAISAARTDVPAPQPAPQPAPPPAAPPASARWKRPAVEEPDESASVADFDSHEPTLAEELSAAANGHGSRGWAWTLGALVMAVALTAQAAHYFRAQLARDATLGPPLRAIYEQLGRPLPPNWNLAAFELRQWGANESTPSAVGALTVRASLKNGAGYAQPMPLLRLDLEDRFGNTIARRDFRPAEYLKDPAQATRLLAAGATTEAELAIVGTTAEAVGYRLDVCLRDEAGTVRCAEPDAPPGQAGG